jgi:transcriptional regulator GlxA family with amidase domain
MSSRDKPLNIKIIIFDGFDELDAIAPFEVFRTAREIGIDIDVDLVVLDGAQVTTGAHGLRVQPRRLDLNQHLDVVIVPGGGWIDQAPTGARAEVNRGLIPEILVQLHQAGTTIASVCTGALIVAATGLLSNRPATTHRGAIADLRSAGAEIVAARVVDDGDILTAGGVTSGIDLALWILERYFSPEISHHVEQLLEYERRGTVWRRA